ncbi:MAG: ATP-grasp domain-containing protein [Limibacillus sp.]
MAPTVLLTLGRLPKALDLARGFAEAGWRVVIAEPFRWHLARVSRSVDKCIRLPSPVQDPAGYRRALLEAIRSEGVSLVVPVSEEALHVVAAAPQLPPGVRLFSEPLERLLALHDKLRFIRLAGDYGLPAPETHLLGRPEAADLAGRSATVLKQVHSCSGSGLKFLQRGEALPTPGSLPPTVVQAKLEGRHLSSFTLAENGKARATVVYEGTVFSGSVAVAFRRAEEPETALSWIDRFLEKSGYSGFISFDFIEPEGGPCQAIECNPRVTSGIHFLEPRALAQAVIDPGARTPVPFRKETRLQQVLPCLTETQAALFTGKDFRAKLRQLLGSRDVTWAWHDPLPLLLMTFTSYEILLPSIFQGLTFGEAATRDILWTEPPDGGAVPTPQPGAP